MDFPGCLVVKTLHFQCWGHRLDPWLGKTLHAAWGPKKRGVNYIQYTSSIKVNFKRCLSKIHYFKLLVLLECFNNLGKNYTLTISENYVYI